MFFGSRIISSTPFISSGLSAAFRSSDAYTLLMIDGTECQGAFDFFRQLPSWRYVIPVYTNSDLGATALNSVFTAAGYFTDKASASTPMLVNVPFSAATVGNIAPFRVRVRLLLLFRH